MHATTWQSCQFIGTSNKVSTLYVIFPDRGTEQQVKIDQQVGLFIEGKGPTEEIQ